MEKIFGLDLGTNSIGYAVRRPDAGVNLIDQIEHFGSVIFRRGVGNGKSGEFSYAAERTKHRTTRRLYQARKYRLWETLSVLIEFGLCPLSVEDLDRWRKYDKSKGQKRQYPVDAVEFERWVRLDFDGDGKPKYTSPYHLRWELATEQLDFSLEVNRFKLGRALYHIAQRRGFKSSKGETMKEQEQAEKGRQKADDDGDLETAKSLKKSEMKKSKSLVDYMDKYNERCTDEKEKIKTVGSAFYQLEREGIRVRASVYQAVRSQYREEVLYIFNFQEQLDASSQLFSRLYSEGKPRTEVGPNGEVVREGGSIFYKRPLRSQKSSVGRCTLEPSKTRCPVSHPEFEKFRAFSFINNIQYRRSAGDKEWLPLTAEQKLRLYKEKFLQVRSYFKFEEIRVWLEKEVGKPLKRGKSKAEHAINYDDKTTVSGCPVSGRLKNLLGGEWESWRYESGTERYSQGKDVKEKHAVTYTMEDVWHICFTPASEDEEQLRDFGQRKLGFDERRTKSLVSLWLLLPQGYSMLSLKAVKNINRFLVPDLGKEEYSGLIYPKAALLAKIPEILGEAGWLRLEGKLLSELDGLMARNRFEKRILNIANALIAAYKVLPNNCQFAEKNTSYQLDDDDMKDVAKYTVEAFGEKTWEKEANKEAILSEVAARYQEFFASEKRTYFKIPKLGDAMKKYLAENISTLRCTGSQRDPKDHQPCRCSACKSLSKLYHHSMIEFYKPAKREMAKHNGVLLSKRLLGSPVIGAFKNPMAMKTLHELRKLVNHCLLENMIDEDTQVVVEVARDLNDANMRWAIEAYQREKEAENKAIEKIIHEFCGAGYTLGSEDVNKTRLLLEQNPNYMLPPENRTQLKDYIYNTYKREAAKYKLWLEQGMQCLYTGKVISITELLSSNVEIEHIIPRSVSFDSSQANLTVCDSYYNRNIKKVLLPTQLPNYAEPVVIGNVKYEAIKPRLQAWEDKVARLKENVDFWKVKSKKAQSKEAKDDAIRQCHLWQMELGYWSDKLSRFTMTEVPQGFKNSQLNDTRLITKYAFHYLKSVFSKVEVQKGKVTAAFRQMLNIRDAAAQDHEKKNRDKHSHHAEDAVILSCIPAAARRDKMLELFYKIQEEEEFHSVDDWRQELAVEIKRCEIANASKVSQHIEDNILVAHVSSDKALTPAIRKARTNGKIIWQRDENNRIKTDEKDRKLPQMRVMGDCIRGQLHQETFLGAIKTPLLNDDGKPQRTPDGKIAVSDELSFVKREKLVFRVGSTGEGFASLDELKSKIVDAHLYAAIEKQCEGKTFKDAITNGFFAPGRGGEKEIKLRHVRIFVRAKKPLEVKEQAYKSDKEYKQHYYAAAGDLYVMCRYVNAKRTKSVYEIYSLFDVSRNRLAGVEDVPQSILDKAGKESLTLDCTIKTGGMVLLYSKTAEELTEMSAKELSKRLYVVLNFENGGCRVNLKRHLCALPDKDLKGASVKDFNHLPDKIRCSVNTISFLLGGKDFELTPAGEIQIKRNAQK